MTTTDPHRMKVKELKDALRAKGLKTSGLKAVLLARLLTVTQKPASAQVGANTHSNYARPAYTATSAATMNAQRKRLQQLQQRQRFQEDGIVPAPKRARTNDAPPMSMKDVEVAFTKYAGENEDVMETDGVLMLCEDLGVEPEEPSLLVLSYHMKAENMGKFTRAEFLQGFQSLRCPTVAALKEKMPSLGESFSFRSALLPLLYKFVFKWACEETQRNMLRDTACALWPLLIKSSNAPFIDSWIEFVSKDESVKVVTRDTWNQFLDFCVVVDRVGMSKYDEENDAWPVLIDNFVEYYTEQQAAK